MLPEEEKTAPASGAPPGRSYAASPGPGPPLNRAFRRFRAAESWVQGSLELWRGGRKEGGAHLNQQGPPPGACGSLFSLEGPGTPRGRKASWEA